MKRKGAGYHHGDLRRALVEATIRLVDVHGVEAFTLRAAAKRAGVSDGAPYHHFADKDSLLAAAAEAGFTRLCEEMQRAADQSDAPDEQCVALGVAYVQFATQHPAWFRLMFGRLPGQRQRHPGLARAADRARGLLKELLATGLAAPPGATEPVAFGSWALVHGLSVLAIDGHFGATGKDARKLERLVLGALRAFTGSNRPLDAGAPGPRADVPSRPPISRTSRTATGRRSTEPPVTQRRATTAVPTERARAATRR